MSVPTRHEIARSNDNSEIAYIISGTTSFDATGPLTISGGVLTAGARRATVTGGDITNYGYVGAIVVTDVTAVSGSPTIRVSIDGKDSTSGKYYNIVSGSMFVSAGYTEILQVHPSFPSGGIQLGGALSGASLVTIQRKVDALPRIWRIKVAHFGGTDSATYTVGVNPLLR